MGKLILTLDGQELAQYELEKERYTIGRLADNDIHIDNMAVSGHHALIINILKDSFLEDLNSTNGTYVNGKLVKKHALQESDVITIGRHALKYVSGKAAAPGGDADDFEKTMIIRPGTKSQTGVPSMDSVNKAISDAGGAPIGADGKAAALPKAKLQVLSGGFAGKELELNKALTTLGRQGQGFPTVNGKEIGAQAQKLADNDVIELAGVKMGFYEMK